MKPATGEAAAGWGRVENVEEVRLSPILSGKIHGGSTDSAKASPPESLLSRHAGIKFRPLIPSEVFGMADSMENFGSHYEYIGFCE